MEGEKRPEKKKRRKRTLVSRHIFSQVRRVGTHDFCCSATEERADQLARRQVKVTKQHNEEVRQLLKLMGIPWVTVSDSLMPSVRASRAHVTHTGTFGS